MREKLSKNEKAIVEVLNDGHPHTAKQLASDTGMKVEVVRRTISGLRWKFNNAHTEVRKYIVLTKEGYTTSGSAEGHIYEANFRFRLGMGVLYNGMYVFKKCRMLGHKEFEKTRVEWKPKLIEFNNVIEVK